MKRLSLLLLVLVFAGCATVSEQRYGYVDDGRHGGYYYDREPARSPMYFGMGWYNPYDVMFWGLRYSYFDPFWYPGFYYGVTYFPRYYYPFGPWGSWYAGGYSPWRWHHPYSPYWGSYWDHYYAGHWHRPAAGRLVRPSAGRHGAYADDGVTRFGSARNAAERAAAQAHRRGDGLLGPRDRIMTREGWRSTPHGVGSARTLPPTRRAGAAPPPSGRSISPPRHMPAMPRSQPSPSRGMRSAPAGSGGRSGRRAESPPSLSWSRPQPQGMPTATDFPRADRARAIVVQPAPARSVQGGSFDRAPARRWELSSQPSGESFRYESRISSPGRSAPPSRGPASESRQR